ncbi:nucleotide exchange factor GrpE [Halostella salina]|uniref:nucleotide exchange factor GrpE n=1 Tax=Halostella salina TaxID=1547897 RepID=UPI000EF78CDE
MSEDEGTDAVAPEEDAAAEADGDPETEATADVSASDEERRTISEQLPEAVSEHDEELGADVRRLLEKAVELDRRVEELEAERDEYEDRVEELEAELDDRDEDVEDLEDRLKRKQADFQNYKKRAKKRQDQIRDRATEDLVERLLDVRDNLKRAVEEDHDNVESIREGVEMTLSEFDRVLDGEDVAEVDPDPGTAVDPQRHEVMMRVESDQPADTIAEVYTPGYEMSGKVLRTAQVTVSDGTGDAESDGDEAEDDAESDGDEADADGDDEAIELDGEVDDAADEDDADDAATDD